MASNDIKCQWHNNNKRYFYITEDSRVLPCCYYADKKDQEDDKIFFEYSKENPDWNDLSIHSMKDIMNNKMYQEHLWYPGWEAGPSPVCVRNCGLLRTKPKKFTKEF
jgi:hypothetical protein